MTAARARRRDLEVALVGGHWMPNPRGVQVWQPCFYDHVQTCPTHSNLIPKENN